MASLETTLAERGRDVVGRIEAEAKLLTTQLEATLATIEQTVVVRGGELDERWARRSQEAMAIFDSGIEAADNRSTARLEEVRTSLEEVFQRIDFALAARSEMIKESLTRSTLEAARKLGDGGRDITQVIVARSTELEESLRARTEALTQALSELANDINAKLTDQVNDMTGSLGGHVDRFRDEVVAPMQSLAGQVQAGGAEIADALARHAVGLSETVETHVQRINVESTAQLVARIEELRGLIEGPASELVARLSARGDEVAGQIASVSEHAVQGFDQQVANLVALLTRRGDDLLAALGASAAGSVRELGSLSGQIGVAVETSAASLRAAAEAAQTQSAETISALVMNLTSEIDRVGAALRETVESNAGASVTTLNAAGERMRGELGQVLERLGQVGSVLDRVVGAAGQQLRAVEGGLGERTEQLQGSLVAMSDQIAALSHLSTETHKELDVLVARLSGQTAALAELARDLAANQEAIDLGLQKRHDSLQSLFVEIAEKSQEFDAVARHFAASFEDSFAKAQARAQEISATLTVATKNAAATVAGQFQAIRDNTGKEREKTAEALQAAYDQANAQLNDVLTKTAERFQQSVGEVRQMAAEMQRQLEETRRELRRGVLELPEETAEAATAMRRVVSDQIKALKELTAVVAASESDFDVADPTPPAKPAGRVEAHRKTDAAQLKTIERMDEGQLTIAAPAEPVRPRRRPRPARARRSRPPRPPPASAANREDGCRTCSPPLRATRRRSRAIARCRGARRHLA